MSVERRKVRDNVAEVVELSDGLVKHGGETGGQAAMYAAPTVFFIKGLETVLLRSALSRSAKEERIRRSTFSSRRVKVLTIDV